MGNFPQMSRSGSSSRPSSTDLDCSAKGSLERKDLHCGADRSICGAQGMSSVPYYCSSFTANAYLIRMIDRSGLFSVLTLPRTL